VFPTQNLHLVLDVLLAFLRCEPLVVLEFILYAEPPNPLSSYEHALADNSIGCPIHLPVESATAARNFALADVNHGRWMSDRMSTFMALLMAEENAP
jgi:hypothetical protein